MPRLIPTSTTLTEYTQTTTLDGRAYVLHLLHNPRLDRWGLDVMDQGSDPIAMGRRVVCEYDLLKGVVDSRRPRGLLIARDYSAPDFSARILSTDPGLNDLGNRVKLIYYEVAEIAEFEAANA